VCVGSLVGKAVLVRFLDRVRVPEKGFLVKTLFQLRFRQILDLLCIVQVKTFVDCPFLHRRQQVIRMFVVEACVFQQGLV